MGVAATLAPKFGTLVGIAVLGLLFKLSTFPSNHDGTQPPVAFDAASEIDWASRAAFKAGVTSATHAIQRRQAADEFTNKRLSVQATLAKATAADAVVTIGGRRTVSCSALAATALASPPPTAAAVSEGDTAAAAAGTAATPYNNCYVVTLQRDVLRTEHVRNLTSVDLRGGNIVWAIDSVNVSDEQIVAWQHEGCVPPLPCALALPLASFMICAAMRRCVAVAKVRTLA
jgi:hypothetical protein